MKILYVTTVGITMIFFKSFIKELIDDGNEIHIASNEEDDRIPDCYREWGCRIHSLPWSRSPLKVCNISAVKQLKRLVEAENYDIVHCHTPVAAFGTRIACRGARKKGTKVFYTAHGFHFYKGAPMRNWLIYYTAEKLCAPMTDVLITINHEDYELAKKKLRAGKVEYVPGVGIDADRFKSTSVDRASKRRELHVPEDAFLLVSVGELNKNKNHEVVIRALSETEKTNIHYMIAGDGPLKEYLQNIAEQLGLSERLHLLGYRDDVAELYKTADAIVFPSIREGLGLAAVEGMAAGLPIIAADNRGTREFAVDGKNGIVCPCHDVSAFKNAIEELYRNVEMRHSLGRAGETDAAAFCVDVVTEKMKEIYCGEI